MPKENANPDAILEAIKKIEIVSELLDDKNKNNLKMIAEGKVSVRDLQTTILRLMGLDAHQFTYPFQGLNQRLIGPAEEGEVVKGILV